MRQTFFLFLLFTGLISFRANAQDPTLNWAFSLNGSIGGSANVKKIVKDASGYTYITGSFTGTVDFDPSSGGTVTKTSAGGTDIFLAKYDGTGNYVWAFSMGTGQNDVGNSLKLDGIGNIYIIGQFANGSPSIDFDPSATTYNLNIGGATHTFLAKYDGSGNFLWVKGFGASGPTDIGYDLVLDASRNIFMIGTTSSASPGVDYDPGSGTVNLITNGGADIVLAKYDASGNYIWAKNIGGTGADTPYSLGLDGSGNVYLTGSFTGTVDFDPSATTNALTSAGGTDIFIAKYDGSGNYLWANRIGSSGADIGYGLALDGSGNVYVTGGFNGTVDFDPGSSTSNLVTSSGVYTDIFLAKYDVSGNYIWAKSMGGVNYDYGYGLVLDGSGNIYLTGAFYRDLLCTGCISTADFDPGAGTANLTSQGLYDIFIGKYDASGNYVWAKAFGGNSNDVGYSVTLDASGNLLVAGVFNGTIDFDPGSGVTNLVSTGAQDIVIASYASPSATNTAGAASSTPTLCINTALTNITHTTTGATGIGTATGLPTGVTAAWASNTITISGTPTTSGTFNYSIPLTGGTGSVNATGTIVVTAANTASAASSSPTLYINSVLTNITYTTSGATGIGTATGLPAGVTAAWASNSITISGTPTQAGVFNYSIPLTGGCASINATGAISVASVVITSSASSNSICFGTSVTFTATAIGASSPSYQWKKNGVKITGETASTFTITTLSNNDAISVDMTASGISSTGSIVSSNLVLNLDAGNATSYPGSGTAWTDLSGNGNNGSFVGSLSYSSTDGGTVVFSGGASNDYVSIANSSSLNLTTAGTLSIWINPSSLTQRSLTSLIGKTINGAANGQSYYLYWNGGNITGIIQNGGVYKSISTPVPTVLGWYNYVFSWGNGYLKLYKNGEQAATPVANTMNAQSLTTTVNIGGYIFGGAGGNQNTFNGKIPIVHIYGRSLSDAEVLQNFNAQSSRFLSTPISSNVITITVTAANIASAASSTPTVNINVPITNITHTTTVATGIGTPTGLPAGVNAVWASNTITISGTPTNAGTFNYTISLTGGCGTVNATGTIIVLSSYTWTGSGGDDIWGNGNNWSTGAQPNAGAEIVISSGNPILNADYAVGGSLTLSGTATLTVNAGKTLSIASGGAANFGGKLVTFKSDATGTGQLGTVAGTLTNATNVLVERHIPAGKRAFRFFGSPVTTTTTIKQNWMENATPGVLAGYPYRTTSVYNPNPGYGTLITGTGGNTNGFDESQTNNPSLFTFNNTTGAWVTSTNTSATIAAGSAYRLFVRGDRSYGITASTEPIGGSTILRTTGTIAQGQLTTGTVLPALSQSASGWSLVGNPYQSVVDMSSADVVKSNLTDYYYIWDPRQATRGAYVAYNHVLNTSSNGLSAVNQYLQPGQAFFVQNTTAGSNSLVFKETAKGAVSNQTATFAKNNTKAGSENGYTIEATTEKVETLQTQANYASLSAFLYYTDSLAAGASSTDATRVLFGSQFSNLVDAKDGRKFTNLDESMAIKQGTNLLSMELRSLPDSATKLPLNITQYVDKKYTMRLLWDEKLNIDTLVAYLRDKYTNKETEVKKTGNTDVEYILDADAKSSAADRFEIIFKRTNNQVTAVINYDNGQYIKIYPNPVQSVLNIDFDLGQNRLVDIKIYDMTGRLVMDRPSMRKGTSLNMTGLAKGTYSVKIWGSDGKLLMTEKIIKD